MSLAVIILRILILMIVVLPNYLFYKKLRNIKTKRFKHTLFFFLISIILSLTVFCILAVLRELISDLVNIRIKNNNTFMILFVTATLFFSVLANLFFLNFYLRKINNRKEIELIGKE